MERPRPADSGNESDKETTEKPSRLLGRLRQLPFWEAYMARRQTEHQAVAPDQSTPEFIADDEEDEETEERPATSRQRRARTYLRQFFRRQGARIERPAADDALRRTAVSQPETTGVTAPVSPELLERQAQANEREVRAETDEGLTDYQGELIVDHADRAGDQTVELPELGAAPSEAQPADEAAAASSDQQPALAEAQPAPPQDAAYRMDYEDVPVAAYQPRRSDQFPPTADLAADGVPPPYILNRQTEATRYPAGTSSSREENRDPETVVLRDNKGVAAAVVLTGAESIGRRRADKRLQKAVNQLDDRLEHQDKQLHTVDRRLRESVTDQDAARSRTNRQLSQVEAALSPQQPPETPDVPPNERVSANFIQLDQPPERQVSPRAVRQASEEVPPTEAINIPPAAIPLPEKGDTAPLVPPPAERYMIPPPVPESAQPPISAAPRNESAERLRGYDRASELLHETSDAQRMVNPSQGATPIGSVLAGSPYRQPVTDEPSAAKKLRAWLDPTHPGSGAASSTYRQAARGGFVTALIVIAFFVAYRLLA